MKRILMAASLLAAFSAYAETPKFENLSKGQVEDVANEFAMNFSHTSVNAPETDGVWGVEVGVIAGRTGSPELKKVVDQAGGDGKDFKNIYHAGIMARAHFPFEIFVEATMLPEREISDVEVKANSFGLGWNAGSHFGLPLDIAIGANISSSDLTFKQRTTVVLPDDTETNVGIESKTQVFWAGVSKTFLFVTPYAKVGTAKSESDVNTGVSNSTVFASGEDKVNVESSGTYWAVGANLEFFFFKLGIETSRQADVGRTSAKFSLDF